MSNDTTEHVIDRFDATVDSSLTHPFTRERLAIAGTKMEVYVPEDGRPPHSQVTLWDATLDGVDVFVASDGAVCTTLRCEVNGQTVDLALWGITIDALAVAVEAAQR